MKSMDKIVDLMRYWSAWKMIFTRAKILSLTNMWLIMEANGRGNLIGLLKLLSQLLIVGSWAPPVNTILGNKVAVKFGLWMGTYRSSMVVLGINSKPIRFIRICLWDLTQTAKVMSGIWGSSVYPALSIFWAKLRWRHTITTNLKWSEHTRMRESTSRSISPLTNWFMILRSVQNQFIQRLSTLTTCSTTKISKYWFIVLLDSQELQPF